MLSGSHGCSPVAVSPTRVDDGSVPKLRHAASNLEAVLLPGLLRETATHETLRTSCLILQWQRIHVGIVLAAANDITSAGVLVQQVSVLHGVVRK